MFAVRSRMEAASRAILVAVMLFNAFAPVSGLTRTVYAQGSEPLSTESPTVTPTETPTTTPTAEPELTPVTTATPVVETATPSPVESQTEIPLESTADLAGLSKADVPALTLSTESKEVISGETLQLDWTIDGITVEEHKLLFRLHVPAGFILLEKHEGTFDESTSVLTLEVFSTAGQIELIVQDFSADVTLEAELLENEAVIANASLVLPYKEQFVLDENGGSIEAQDGKIKVEFPSGVLPEKATIHIGNPSKEEMPAYPLLRGPFEITAEGENSKQDLKHFGTELSIFVSYAELDISEEQQSNLHLYWYDKETQEWVGLPTMVNKETKTLQAFTDHFTVFDININYWQASHLPTVDAFQVSSFTGAGTYLLPIQVPAGPGGLQPNLTLSYNSQIVDQASLGQQASWVGMGWSLETGSIEADTHGTDSSADDTYLLNVGGVSTRLVLDSSGGTFHAADENFWKITGPSAGNGYTWTVQDKQGNTYYFETTLNYPYESEYCNTGWGVFRWMLTRVRNIYGKEILYTYDDSDKHTVRVHSSYSGCTSWNEDHPIALYPQYITYAGDRYRVEFVLGSRQDYTLIWDIPASTYHAYERKRLERIDIEQDTDSDGSYETILRQYIFTYKANNDGDIIFPGYTWSAGGQTNTLASVLEKGVGGITGLPETTFSYSDGAGGNVDNLHLLHVANGYGGSVDFSYDTQPWYYQPHASKSHTNLQKFGQPYNPCYNGEYHGPEPWVGAGCNQMHLATGGLAYDPEYNNTRELVRPGGMYRLSTMVYDMTSGSTMQLGLRNGDTDDFASVGTTEVILQLPATADVATPLINVSGFARFSTFKFELLSSVYRVTQKRISDGNGHIYTSSYTYTGAAVNDTIVSSGVCGFTMDPTYNEVVDTPGCFEYFPKFSEFRGHSQVTETGPDGSQTVTQFHQSDVLRGRPVSVTIQAGSQSLSRSDYSYVSTALPVYPWYVGLGRNWVYTSAVDNKIYATDGSYSQAHTLYTYEPTYGNLTAQTEYFATGSMWNYRTTTTEYVANVSKYLVGLPARQQVKDGANVVLAETLYIYDDNTTYDQQPGLGTGIGKLTAVRTWVDGALSTGRYSQTSFGYDGWGNRTTVTTYTGYGTAGSPPPSGPGQYAITTTAYDPTFHVYPIQVTTPGTTNVPGGLITRWKYDYNQDGTDDYILGLPTRESDANDPDPNSTTEVGNTSVRAIYDAFGRLERLIRPGDDYDNPTVFIKYFDTMFFHTEIRQRIDTSRYVTLHRYYDGLGRQTKVENAFATGIDGIILATDIVTTQLDYPSVNVVKQSMPFGAGESPVYTTTTIDPAARTTTVTAPDDTSTITTQDGLTSTTTDARGNSTTSVSDLWGRVASVLPPPGSPSIAYSYDPLGRLTTVLRGAGVTAHSLPPVDPASPGTNGLAAWWSLNENTSTRLDSHSGLNHLADLNTVSSGTGKQGLAADFERDTQEYLSKGSTPQLQMATSDIYVAAWIKAESFVGYPVVVAKRGSTNPQNEFQLRVSTAKQAEFMVWDSAGNYTIATYSTSLVEGQWYYVEGWTDKTNRTAYVNVNNGTPGSATWASGQNRNGSGTAALLVGARDNNGIGEYWDGLIDEVVYFKRILTFTERTWLYNNGAGRNYSAVVSPVNPGTTSLSAWWSLNETGGTRSNSHSSAYYLADNNGVPASFGLQGKAASFVAVGNKYLSADDAPGISTGNVDFTLTTHVYLNSNSAAYVIMDKSNLPGAAGTSFDYRLVHNPGTGFRFRVSSSTYVDSGPVLAPGWHTVIAWHDSINDTINIQVDNGVVNTVAHTTGATDTSYRLTLGAYADGTGPLDGRIDEAALYKRVLTASERAWLFNGGQGRAYSDLGATAPATPTLTTIEYDHAGRKTKMIDPDMGTWTYGYDPQGNLTLQTDARGCSMTLWYDTLNRLISRESNGSCGGGLQVLESYVYDELANGKGRRTSMGGQSNGQGNSAFWKYDERGRVIEENRSLAGLSPQSTKWLYNSSDLPIWMKYPDGEEVDYTYNNRMLLYSVIGDSEYVTSTDYDSAGRLDLRTFGNTTRTDYVYYPSTEQGGRLQSLQSGIADDPTLLQDLAYTYDSVGNIQTILDDMNSSQKQCFQYDALNRLTNATTHADASQGCTTELGLGSYDEAYSYDSAGNLDVKAGVDLIYDDAAHAHAVTRTDNATPSNQTDDNTYVYDANGNQTSRVIDGQTYTLTYDASNRLLNVSGPSLTAAFQYDPDGGRIKSTINGTTTYYIGSHYEIKNPGSGQEVTKYYYAGSARVALRKYIIPQSDTLIYLLGDHLGSTSLAVKSTITGVRVTDVVSEVRYKPWGEVRSVTDNTTLPTRYTYTGQYSYMNDEATDLGSAGFDLMFYNARWYDSYLNHFTQPDTIVPDPYNPQDWDRYGYARFNPVRYVDPTGHSVDCGLGDAFCQSGEYNAGGLISLYRHYRTDSELDRPYDDEPKSAREQLSKELEDFLRNNPNAGQDNLLSCSTCARNYGLFYGIRHDYWRDRCLQPGSGCDLLYDPDRLYEYYDLHLDIQFMRFDPSKVDWVSTSFDAGSLALSVAGLQFVIKGAKWLANAASVVFGGGSAAYSFGSGDGTGGWLSIAGSTLPPPFGTAVSGASVIRDVSAGVYYIPYVPAIPR